VSAAYYNDPRGHYNIEPTQTYSLGGDGTMRQLCRISSGRQKNTRPAAPNGRHTVWWPSHLRCLATRRDAAFMRLGRTVGQETVLAPRANNSSRPTVLPHKDAASLCAALRMAAANPKDYHDRRSAAAIRGGGPSGAQGAERVQELTTQITQGVIWC
jgi:hypothetical protein